MKAGDSGRQKNLKLQNQETGALRALVAMTSGEGQLTNADDRPGNPGNGFLTVNPIPLVIDLMITLDQMSPPVIDRTSPQDKGLQDLSTPRWKNR